jgi:hypothetical protein
VGRCRHGPRCEATDAGSLQGGPRRRCRRVLQRRPRHGRRRGHGGAVVLREVAVRSFAGMRVSSTSQHGGVAVRTSQAALTGMREVTLREHVHCVMLPKW